MLTDVTHGFLVSSRDSCMMTKLCSLEHNYNRCVYKSKCVCMRFQFQGYTALATTSQSIILYYVLPSVAKGATRVTFCASTFAGDGACLSTIIYNMFDLINGN